MRFDGDGGLVEEDFEVVTKESVDCHIQIPPGQTGGDVADYPQNPYGQRDDKSNSLYFNDGVRSVDFVLVWKKLVPSSDEERSDVLKNQELDDINLKETDRLAKREVFEKNLAKEGLELERKTVDEEVNFVKIHAPLEVLRRYAEILKLRLPMKEVSHEPILIN